MLCEEIAHAVRANDAVIDGEIVCMEPDGRSHLRKYRELLVVSEVHPSGSATTLLDELRPARVAGGHDARDANITRIPPWNYDDRRM